MITESLARCIAKISGDGYLYHRYIRYSNTCPELLQEFREDVVAEFGDIPLTEGVGNSGTPFVQIHRKKIIKTFLDVLPDFRSDFIFVPPAVHRGNLSVKKAYLRAFYDDEGSPCLRLNRSTNEWKRSLTLTSNSKRILEQIKQILEEDFHISTNSIIRTSRLSERDRSFVLGITGKENLINFQKNIGSLVPSKIRRLALIIESYGQTYARNRQGFEEIKEKADSFPRFPLKAVP
tara:strand:+ start:679 stop:1383 length:705 start_codon:yes stop_codon:yes gene_type:complete